jgi:hypothetical protein
MRTDQSSYRRHGFLIIDHAMPRATSRIPRVRGAGGVQSDCSCCHSPLPPGLGVAAIETPSKGGRRRQSLTLEEVQEFLVPFFAQTERGEVATGGPIWRP